jgi:hypothetical protein
VSRSMRHQRFAILLALTMTGRVSVARAQAVPSQEVCAACASVAPVGVRATPRPSMLSERLRLLDATLQPLATTTSGGHVAIGLLSLGAAAGLTTLGFVLPEVTPDASLIGNMLFVQGTHALANGILALVWVPARVQLPPTYVRMPRETVAQRRARARAGEAMLNAMATDGARRHVVTGVIHVTFSVLSPTLVYADQIFGGAPMPQPVALNYVILGTAVIATVTQIADLFKRTEEERIRDTYRAEVARLRAEGASIVE